MNCQSIQTSIGTATRREPVSGNLKAHIDACADCRRHADEITALTSLLRSQPRVTAPADFDFKLRARIARAEAEPKGAFSALEKFWTKSFSWSQAATATATLAVAVTLTMVHFNRNYEQPMESQPVTASQSKSVETARVAGALVESSDKIAAPAGVSVSRNLAAVKSAPRAIRMVQASDKSLVVDAPSVAVNTAAANSASSAREDSWKGFNRERGQMVSAPARSMLIGAEQSSAAKTIAFVPSI